MKSEILRKDLESKSIVKVGGAFDALSAKLVESHGFDAIWAGSFAISATHALPDASILTMTEFLSVATSMAESCKIPVIADCDTGFGGPSNVNHMVKKYENAGIAAICIEDKIFPKQNSLLENGRQELLSEKDFVAKIIAGKEAKIDPDFMIIARVESLMYEQACADAILIHSKMNTSAEIFEFTDEWKGNIPLVAIPTNYPSVTLDELVSHEIKMVIYANQTLRAAHASMSRILKQMINSNSLSEVEEEMSSMEDIFVLQEMYRIKDKEKEIEAELKRLGYIN